MYLFVLVIVMLYDIPNYCTLPLKKANSQSDSNSYVNVSKLPSLTLATFLVIVENKFDRDNGSMTLTFTMTLFN